MGSTEAGRHDPAPRAGPGRTAAGRTRLEDLPDEMVDQVIVHLPKAARNVLSLADSRLCTRVRHCSRCRLDLGLCQGRAVAALPSYRQFKACTSITYKCRKLAPQQQQQQQQQLRWRWRRQQQQQRQDGAQEQLPDQLGAVAALLRHALEGMPQLSSVDLTIETYPLDDYPLRPCIRALEALSNLTSLNLTLPAFSETKVGQLGSLTQLQHLQLRSSNPQLICCLQLAPLAKLVKLASFSCAGLAPASLAKPAAATTTSSSSSSGDGGGANGASCLPTSSLTSLTLSQCGLFTGRWGPHVAAAGRLRRLEVQDISLTQVDDLIEKVAAGAPALRQLVLHLPRVWEPRPGLPALEGLEVLQLSTGLVLKHPDHWRWLAGCRSLAQLHRLFIAWSEQVTQPRLGFELPQVQKAGIAFCSTSRQQLAAVLRCFPALRRLGLSIARVQQQQQQEEGGEGEEQLRSHTAVAEHGAGAQQRETAHEAGRRLLQLHSKAVATAAQQLVASQLLAVSEPGLPYQATTLPALGPLKALALRILPTSTAATTVEELQQALEALAPLFGSVITLTLGLNKWRHTQEQGEAVLDLSCFPQLVALHLRGHGGLQLQRLILPQLWQLTFDSRNCAADLLPAPPCAQALINCYRRMAKKVQEGVRPVALQAALDTLGFAESGAWKSLLQQKSLLQPLKGAALIDWAGVAYQRMQHMLGELATAATELKIALAAAN